MLSIADEKNSKCHTSVVKVEPGDWCQSVYWVHAHRYIT